MKGLDHLPTFQQVDALIKTPRKVLNAPPTMPAVAMELAGDRYVSSDPEAASGAVVSQPPVFDDSLNQAVMLPAELSQQMAEIERGNEEFVGNQFRKDTHVGEWPATSFNRPNNLLLFTEMIAAPPRTHVFAFIHLLRTQVVPPRKMLGHKNKHSIILFTPDDFTIGPKSARRIDLGFILESQVRMEVIDLPCGSSSSRRWLIQREATRSGFPVEVTILNQTSDSLCIHWGTPVCAVRVRVNPYVTLYPIVASLTEMNDQKNIHLPPPPGVPRGKMIRTSDGRAYQRNWVQQLTADRFLKMQLQYLREEYEHNWPIDVNMRNGNVRKEMDLRRLGQGDEQQWQPTATSLPPMPVLTGPRPLQPIPLSAPTGPVMRPVLVPTLPTRPAFTLQRRPPPRPKTSAPKKTSQPSGTRNQRAETPKTAKKIELKNKTPRRTPTPIPPRPQPIVELAPAHQVERMVTVQEVEDAILNDLQPILESVPMLEQPRITEEKSAEG